MSSARNVVLCQCAGAGLLDPSVLRAVSTRLQGERAQLHTVPDLCRLAAHRDPGFARWASESPLTVMACYPRAVKWLFAAAGAPLPADAQLVNLRTERPQADGRATITTSEGEHPSPGEGRDEPIPTRLPLGSAGPVSPKADDWDPWFPVIDFDRCTHCLQCLSFCLFGVYQVGEDRRVLVRAPENCKANCPACARVCPEVAIMFPKHKATPINGDAVVDPSSRETIKVDISAVLGGDIYSSLRSRGQGRFSKDREHEQALRERQKFLAQLVQTGDISREQLLSLGKLASHPLFVEERASTLPPPGLGAQDGGE